jgi:hypothetical protein
MLSPAAPRLILILSISWRAVIFHHELLSEGKFFRAHSNHGLFQALGQLAAARRFPFFEVSNEHARLANERLALSIESQFDSDGVHREHSPRYQLNLIGSLIGARDSGLLEQARVRERLLLAECSLMWMVTPRSGLAAFGDSEHRRQDQSKPIGGRYQAPALQWLLSGGQLGARPPSEVKAYIDSGYAFARIYSEDSAPAEASYLAQLAAFHSRVHKHADHLTFIWEEGLLPILTDPGQYGYAGEPSLDQTFSRKASGIATRAVSMSNPHARTIASRSTTRAIRALA